MSTELRKRVRGLHHVQIEGAGCQLLIEEPVQFRGPFALQGRGLAIGAFSRLGRARCSAETALGRYCSLGDEVVLGASLPARSWLAVAPPHAGQEGFGWHAAMTGFEAAPISPAQRSQLQGPPIRIGNDVWIGSGVRILRGVNIGDGAILNEGSLITEDVPPYAVVSGSSSQPLDHRFSPEMITRLLKVRWWELDPLHWSGRDLSDAAANLDHLENVRSSGQARLYRPAWSDVSPFTG